MAAAPVRFEIRIRRSKMAAFLAAAILVAQISPMEARILADFSKEDTGFMHSRSLKLIGDIVRTAIGARPRNWRVSANIGAGLETPGPEGPVRVDATTGGSIESEVAQVPPPILPPYYGNGAVDPYFLQQGGGFPPPIPVPVPLSPGIPLDPAYQPQPYYPQQPYPQPGFPPPFAPAPIPPQNYPPPPPIGQQPGQPFGVAGAVYRPGSPGARVVG